MGHDQSTKMSLPRLNDFSICKKKISTHPVHLWFCFRTLKIFCKSGAGTHVRVEIISVVDYHFFPCIYQFSWDISMREVIFLTNFLELEETILADTHLLLRGSAWCLNSVICLKTLKNCFIFSAVHKISILVILLHNTYIYYLSFILQ